MNPLTVAPPGTLDSAIHIIQTALTPVFLLSGIGTLLNTFNTRLSRVADQFDHVSDLLEATQDGGKRAAYERHLVRLRRRRSALDTAVILSGLGGASVCATTFALFIGGLHSDTAGAVLLWLFGTSLGCTVAALMAFLVDTMLGWHGVRTDGALPLVGALFRRG